MKKFIQFLLGVFPMLCFPQNAFVDSLFQTLDGKPDDIKITALLDYSKGYSMRNPGLSLELAEKAYELAQRSENPLLISNTLNGLSILNYYLGKNSVAIELLLRSIDYMRMAQKNQTDSTFVLKRLLGMYSNAGNIYHAMGELEKSLEMHLRTLRLADTLMQLQPENAEIIPSCIRAMNNTAVCYWNLGKIDKSKILLEHALELGRKYNDPQNIIFTLNNIGLIQIDRAEYRQAIETYTEALKIGTEMNDSIGICGNYNNLGLIMEKTGNHRKALSYYLSSLRISERMGYSIGISNTCSNLVKVYGEINKPDSAMFYSYKGIDEARRSGSKTYLLNNYEVLYHLFEKTKRFDKALEYHKLYVAVKDSIFNEQKSGQIAEMETKYETEKKEQENVILRTDIELQKTTQRLLFVAISALLLLALSLFFLARYKTRLLKQKSVLFEQEQKMQALEIEKKEIERKYFEDQVFAEQEINRLQQFKLEEQNRKLAATAIHIIAKNKILTSILDDIEQAKKDGVSEPDACFRKIQQTVRANLNLDRDWEQFKLHFEEVHPDFFIRLNERYPDLTSGEQKICAYYRINLGTNEIAQILNVTIAGVQKSRHRLRKKMRIDSEIDMTEFMLRF